MSAYLFRASSSRRSDTLSGVYTPERDRYLSIYLSMSRVRIKQDLRIDLLGEQSISFFLSEVKAWRKKLYIYVFSHPMREVYPPERFWTTTFHLHRRPDEDEGWSRLPLSLSLDSSTYLSIYLEILILLSGNLESIYLSTYLESIYLSSIYLPSLNLAIYLCWIYLSAYLECIYLSTCLSSNCQSWDSKDDLQSKRLSKGD